MSAERKADRVAGALLRQIVAGHLAVGSLLPREAELASQYGVNRGVVREAIKLLEVHRLVRPIRRRGTLVLDPLASLSPEVITAMLKPQAGRVDLRMFASLLEVRSEIDVQVCTLAAQRRDDADLAAMRAVVERLDRAVANGAYGKLVEELALTIARATHNPVLEMLVHWNQRIAAELPEAFATVRPASASHMQGLRLLVQLIEERDVQRIAELMRAFHLWATPRMMAAAALASGQALTDVPKPQAIEVQES